MHNPQIHVSGKRPMTRPPNGGLVRKKDNNAQWRYPHLVLYIDGGKRGGYIQRRLGAWFNKQMPSYQYRTSRCGNETIIRSSNLLNGIFRSGKMAYIYWIWIYNVITERRSTHQQQKKLTGSYNTCILSNMTHITLQLWQCAQGGCWWPSTYLIQGHWRSRWCR